MSARGAAGPVVRRLALGFSLLLFGVVAAMAWEALGLEPGSRTIPLAVVTVTAILLGIQGVIDAIAVLGASGERVAPAARGERQAPGRLLITLGGFGTLLAGVLLLGFAAGAGLFLTAWMRWRTGLGWAGSLLTGLVAGLGSWAVFEVLLGVPLHPGWLLS